MLNEKAVLLLEQTIKNNYQEVEYSKTFDDENEFFYEFKINEKISENDFSVLEKKINELDNECYVKLLRISGVYYNGNKENEMINRITGKAFTSVDELNKYLVFLEEAKERDHRKIGQELDLFCFSD